MYLADSYGAKGDGVTNDAHAIQCAIDECNALGGGRVILSSGKTYLSGSIILKSNVELHLEPGCVLRASSDINDYYELRGVSRSTRDESVPSYINSEYAGKPYHAFIYASHEKNVSISGFGAIDGNEQMYYGTDSGYHIEGSYYPRVPMLLLEDIRQLSIVQVTLRSCGFWTLHMVGCDDVLVHGIRILNNLRMANSDGIDPDHCRNVRISDCHIECGDDCIVLKNTKDFMQYGPTENITITNCTLVSTSAAIKFGTEGEDDFRNIVVSGCTISRSNRGISLQIRDCGNVENVVFSGITIETRRFSEEWWGRAEPVCITVADRKPGVKAGHIKNVSFRDIFCDGENGIMIYDAEKGRIQGLHFDNVNIRLSRKSKWGITGYDIRPCEGTGRIETKVAGLYMHKAGEICLHGINIECDESMKEFYLGDVVTDN